MKVSKRPKASASARSGKRRATANKSKKAAKARKATKAKTGKKAKAAKTKAGRSTAARKAGARPVKKAKAKAARPAPPPKAAKKKVAAKAKAKPPVVVAVKPPRRAPGLDRERKTIREAEAIPTPPSSLNMDRSASAVRSGRHELAERIRKHTSTGPAMTGGDVDADWEAAETTGDEAPGGDNPTPDQDVVEEIGQALGITYEDNEELQGGDEVSERDRHRWELDPASKDDFDEED